MPDSQQDMKCPACGSEMQKVFIPNKGIMLMYVLKAVAEFILITKKFKNFLLLMPI